MKFSLIIPTINHVDLVQQCVESFTKHHPEKNYEIIVVDDGSAKEVQDSLKRIKGVDKVVCNESNRGFSYTINRGSEVCEGDIIILCNNDIIFTKPVLHLFSASFDVNPNIGIVGAKLLFPDNTIQHAGVIRTSPTTFGHVYKGMNPDSPLVNKSKYYTAVTGALYAISRPAFETIGKFNEDFFVACEDVEYCLRAWQKGFAVYYNHEIEAVHIEGYTRGNDHKTKMEKGPEWYKKEKKGIAHFEKKVKSIPVSDFESKVNRLNRMLTEPGREVKKVEIGCGYNPQPGYIHIDVRKLPGVDIVCDFEKERLPFKDGEVDEIINNHVIEHISWRKLPFILGEWHRVLRSGGRVFLRTPDLEFICRTYLAGKTTPEWPGDEDFIKQNLSAEVTPAWWANIKLYAGQDYDANFHKHCFDFDMLKALFERFGFTDVTRMNIEPVYSPGEIQMECFKA